MKWSALVPELAVSDIKKSLHFWCDLIGFEVVYERVEEHFAYLALGDAQIMLEQHNPQDNSWETAPFEQPFGRGINFQIEVVTLDSILMRLADNQWDLFIPVEERWYKAVDVEFGQKQFLVLDPDGYLLRLIENLGERPIVFM